MTSPIAWGSVFPVNSTVKSFQYDSKIYALKDGSFVAVWTDASQTGADTSYAAIRGQLFNADGSKKGAEFLINTTTLNYQDYPEVTVLNDGHFVVAWESTGGYVRARAFQANGTAIGNDFQVNSTESDYHIGITALSNGGFAVSYQHLDTQIRVQAFDANLQKSGTEAAIADNDYFTEVVGLQGQYMAFYSIDGKIHGVLRNNDGSLPTGSVPMAISATGDSNSPPQAAKLADGRIIVMWTSQTDAPTGPDLYQIKGQILNANGTKSGGELLLSAPDLTSSKAAAVTALADGGFAVGYLDMAEGRNSADIHISAFNGSGARVGADTILGRPYMSYANGLDITALADGRLAVTWNTTVSEWDDFASSVQGQIVDLRQKGVSLMGTVADDHYYGSKFNDTLKGDAGDDLLFGREGKDTLTGGAGSDAFVFDTAPKVGRAKHIDRITDFNGRSDKIYLDDVVFKGLSRKVGSLDAPVKIDRKAFWKGNAAHDRNDRIIVKSSGDILYDADGSGRGKAVVIAKIDKNAVRHVDASDFLLI